MIRSNNITKKLLGTICYFIPLITVASINSQYFKAILIIETILCALSIFFKLKNKQKVHLELLLIFFLITTLVLKNSVFMKVYPVAVNLSLFIFFVSSLAPEKTPIIEFFCKKNMKDQSIKTKRFTVED